MITLINSDVIEKVSDIEYKYKGCKIIVTDYVDDCNCNVTGKVYAISTDIDTHKELQRMCTELYNKGEVAVVVGYYEEAFVGIQYECKR